MLAEIVFLGHFGGIIWGQLCHKSSAENFCFSKIMALLNSDFTQEEIGEKFSLQKKIYQNILLKLFPWFKSCNYFKCLMVAQCLYWQLFTSVCPVNLSYQYMSVNMCIYVCLKYIWYGKNIFIHQKLLVLLSFQTSWCQLPVSKELNS